MARPRNISNIYDAPKSNVQFSEGQKSKGILDDHAVRGNVATKEGTIEHTPTNDNHIANKKYVDDEIAAIPPSVNYWDRTGTVLSPDTAGDDIKTTGSITLGVDDTSKIKLGSTPADDTEIYFDGSDLIINPKISADGDVQIPGAWNRKRDFRTGDGKLILNTSLSEIVFTCTRAGVGFLSLVPFNNTGMGMHWGAQKQDYSSGNNTIFTEYGNLKKDHDHGAQTNPTVWFHSVTNPDTDNTQWGNLTHDQTDFCINAGKGSIKIGNTTHVPLMPTLTTTERNALTAVNGMIIYNSTTTNMEAYFNGSWGTI